MNIADKDILEQYQKNIDEKGMNNADSASSALASRLSIIKYFEIDSFITPALGIAATHRAENWEEGIKKDILEGTGIGPWLENLINGITSAIVGLILPEQQQISNTVTKAFNSKMSKEFESKITESLSDLPDEINPFSKAYMNKQNSKEVIVKQAAIKSIITDSIVSGADNLKSGMGNVMFASFNKATNNDDEEKDAIVNKMSEEISDQMFTKFTKYFKETEGLSEEDAMHYAAGLSQFSGVAMSTDGEAGLAYKDTANFGLKPLIKKISNDIASGKEVNVSLDDLQFEKIIFDETVKERTAKIKTPSSAGHVNTKDENELLKKLPEDKMPEIQGFLGQGFECTATDDIASVSCVKGNTTANIDMTR